MIVHETSPGSFTEVSGPVVTVADGARLPYSALLTASDEDLAVFGLYRVVMADVPAGKVIESYTIERQGNAVVQVAVFADMPLADLKVAKRDAVGQKAEEILAGGYSHDFGPPHGEKVLQTRDDRDRTNWLTSQAAYAAAIAGGHGAVVGASFRAEDNTTIQMSFADGHAVLLAMAAWGQAVYGRSWALKDEIAAAEDAAALAAIDIEADWP